LPPYGWRELRKIESNDFSRDILAKVESLFTLQGQVASAFADAAHNPTEKNKLDVLAIISPSFERVLRNSLNLDWIRGISDEAFIVELLRKINPIVVKELLNQRNLTIKDAILINRALEKPKAEDIHVGMGFRRKSAHPRVSLHPYETPTDRQKKLSQPKRSGLYIPNEPGCVIA